MLAFESEIKLTWKLKSATPREFIEAELKKKKSNFCSCVLILENERKINCKAQESLMKIEGKKKKQKWR